MYHFIIFISTLVFTNIQEPVIGAVLCGLILAPIGESCK